MTSLNGKDYTILKPWANPTKYEVGQIRSGSIITAITRITDKTFGIYGYPMSQTIKLDYCKDQQSRREKGQKVTTIGNLMFVEKIC